MMSAPIKTITPQSIKEAAEIIRSGGLVIFPTETVYGIGANALDGKAAAKIFEAKGRPQFNPLISHVASLKQAEELAHFDARAKALAQAFWPGPLTLILPRAENSVSELVSAGLDTVALRMPSHPAALALIKEAGVPIAAPSANRSGEPSATTPKHAADSLGDKVDLILAAGPCEVGLESTVLDLSGEEALILRPGAITPEDIEPLIGPVRYGHEEADVNKPKSPGLLLKHYAPNLPVRLKAVDVKQGETLLAFGSIKFMGVEGGGAAKDLPEERLRNLSENADLHEAAANLFKYLRELDKPELSGIAVMDIPNTGLGIAINDRLKRAAES